MIAIFVVNKRLFAGEDEGGAGLYGDLAALDGAETFGVDPAVAGYHGPAAGGDTGIYGGVVAVEHHLDLFPLIAVGMVVERIRYEAGLGALVEFQMAGDVGGRGHAEGRMSLAELDEFAVIVEEFAVGVLQVPVDGVDGVG